jgi:hypothetical protein
MESVQKLVCSNFRLLVIDKGFSDESGALLQKSVSDLIHA